MKRLYSLGVTLIIACALASIQNTDKASAQVYTRNFVVGTPTGTVTPGVITNWVPMTQPGSGGSGGGLVTIGGTPVIQPVGGAANSANPPIVALGAGQTINIGNTGAVSIIVNSNPTPGGTPTYTVAYMPQTLLTNIFNFPANQYGTGTPVPGDPSVSWTQYTIASASVSTTTPVLLLAKSGSLNNIIVGGSVAYNGSSLTNGSAVISLISGSTTYTLGAFESQTVGFSPPTIDLCQPVNFGNNAVSMLESAAVTSALGSFSCVQH